MYNENIRKCVKNGQRANVGREKKLNYIAS